MFRLISLALLVTLAQSVIPHSLNGYAPSYPIEYAPLPPAASPAQVIPLYGGYYWSDWDSSSSESRESSAERRRPNRDQRRRRDNCGRLRTDCVLTDGTSCTIPEITYYWDRNIKKAYINCRNFNALQPWGIATAYSTVNDLAIGTPATKIAQCDRFGLWRATNAYYNQTLEFNGVRCLLQAQVI